LSPSAVENQASTRGRLFPPSSVGCGRRESSFATPQEQLARFLDPEDKAADEAQGDDFPEAERNGMEPAPERGPEDHGNLQGVADKKSAEEPGVPEQTHIERGLAFRAAVENVEPLADGEKSESFRPRLSLIHSRRRAQHEPPEGRRHDGRNHERHPREQVSSQEWLGPGDRSPSHLVALAGVHDEIHGDDAFGDQVVPENLHGREGWWIARDQREQEHEDLGY
jgi:hypothetical protein